MTTMTDRQLTKLNQERPRNATHIEIATADRYGTIEVRFDSDTDGALKSVRIEQNGNVCARNDQRKGGGA